MKKISNLLMMALLAIGMGLTSCDEQLDNAVTPGTDEQGEVTSITVDLSKIDEKYLDTEKTKLQLTVGDEVTLSFTILPEEMASTEVELTAADATILSIDGLKVKALKEGETKVTAKAGDKTAECTVTVKAANPLATPLTVEAITAGTITVNSPKAGMQYSLNGGAKTAVSGDISVSAGDKVAFYGNGTSITSYNGTKIVGGTADIKVYGNIMSLVDETGFATNTTLTADNAFTKLFNGNAKLTDASGLLLPALTLAFSCYSYMFQNCSSLTTAPAELPALTLSMACYDSMFYGCEALTTAPALPATTLVLICYQYMFYNCSALTSAYVKAAYIATMGECMGMFGGCTAAGVLHTTTANKDSWDSAISSEGWSTWTAAGDWND